MIGTITTQNNIKTLTINFNNAQTINETFGQNSDICNVNNTITEVKLLFENQLIIENFDYPIPTPEQIRVDYVNEPIHYIDIAWPNNVRTDPLRVVALNQSHQANIFMTYPVINNSMNAIQLLSHELGHWFFNRAIEYLIEADNHRVTRSDIPGYEISLSEKVAYYCELIIGGTRTSYHPNDLEMIQEVNRAIQNGSNYVFRQLDIGIERWLRELERD